MQEGEFDIAKQIKMTESLKCQMLAAVSDFFTSMQADTTKAQKTEILADLEIIMYLLAGRMGISKDSLDKKALSKLKAGLLQEERTEWKRALRELCAQMTE